MDCRLLISHVMDGFSMHHGVATTVELKETSTNPDDRMTYHV